MSQSVEENKSDGQTKLAHSIVIDNQDEDDEVDPAGPTMNELLKSETSKRDERLPCDGRCITCSCGKGINVSCGLEQGIIE